MTEAYFVAIVVTSGKLSYFTLERTITPKFDLSEEVTMLCGWTKDHMHLNFGPGPKPDKEEFIKAVMARI